MREIKLHNSDLVALVDDDKYDMASLIPWRLYVNKKVNYARYSLTHNGRTENLQLHRYVMGLGSNDGQQIDHRDRNGLNCQVDNLRICSGSVNSLNRGLRDDSDSGHIGVCKKKVNYGQGFVFVSYLMINGKYEHYRTHHSLDEAVSARQAAERRASLVSAR